MNHLEKAEELTPLERILSAAGDIFFEKGFDGARVDEIARRAGVNKAMLYYHVGDKYALFNAVLVRNLDLALSAIREAVGLEGTPEERFRGLVNGFARTASEADHIVLVFREAVVGGHRLSDDVLKKLREVALVSAGVVLDGSRVGRFRPVNPLLGHMMMVASILMLTVTSPMRSRMNIADIAGDDFPVAPDDFAAAVSDILLHGLALPGPEGDKR